MIKKINSSKPFHNRSLFVLPQLLILCLFLMVFLSSCETTKFLKEGESFVAKNSIKFKGEVEDKSTLEFELSTIIKQKKNGNWLGIFPSEWFYYNHTDARDTTRWDQWVLRRIAEPPSIYEEAESLSTQESMANFLKNRGYFDAKVEFESELKRKRTSATYLIYPGERYYFNDVSIRAEDPKIQAVLDSVSRQSFLKKGAPVDERLYNQESARIRSEILDRGFFDYNTAYLLPLKGKQNGNLVDAELTLVSPKDSDGYQVKKIGKILVYPRYNPLNLSSYSKDTLIGGIHFITTGKLDIKAEVLLNAIYLKSGDIIRQRNIDKTRLQLSKLGLSKFVGIKTIKNAKDPNTIDIQIQLPPKKKMGLDGDFELTTAQNTTASLLSLGTEVSVDFRNRNALKGAELFRSSLAFGIESPLDTFAITSLNFNGSIDLFTPKFVDFFGVLKLMKAAKLLESSFYKNLEENAKTKFSLNYNYIQLRNSYSSNTVSVGLFGYDVQLPRNRRFIFTPTGVNFLNLQAEPEFLAFLSTRELLKLSFTDQLFTGLLFKEMTFLMAKKNRSNTFRQDIRFALETSGLEVYALNQIFSPTKPWKVFNPFAHYFRSELEARWNWKINNKQAFAMRASVGAASAYGAFSKVVPYVKQFYVGGPSSIRAWDVRQLGPGSYEPPAISDGINQPFFQTGDFKLEFNGEYRFDLISVLEGALFVDAGNVWSWQELDRPGAKISWNFLDEIAIGAGAGGRLDFSYFIIRLDVGWKIRYPYAIDGQRWFAFRSPNYNLAIGYPF